MCCATLPLLQLTAGKQVLQCNTCGPLSICVFAWINKHRTEIRHGAANAHAPYCLHAHYSFLLIGRCQIVFKRIFSPNIASGLHPNLAACVHYLWSTISECLNLNTPVRSRRKKAWAMVGMRNRELKCLHRMMQWRVCKTKPPTASLGRVRV